MCACMCVCMCVGVGVGVCVYVCVYVIYTSFLCRPLHIAARKPLPQMMAALIRLGADPSALNSSRRTPLHLLAIKV